MNPETERRCKLLTSAFTSPLGVMPALLQVIEYLTREAKAKAWDEGHGTCCDNRCFSDGNPYRD